MHKIIYLKSALESLDDIHEFISEDNAYYAEEVIDSITRSTRYLETFPYIGTLIEGNIRYIVEPRYRYKIVYRISATEVKILSVSKYREKWKTFDLE